MVCDILPAFANGAQLILLTSPENEMVDKMYNLVRSMNDHGMLGL